MGSQTACMTTISRAVVVLGFDTIRSRTLFLWRGCCTIWTRCFWIPGFREIALAFFV